MTPLAARRRRRTGAVLLLAAAFGAAAFGVGYGVSDATHSSGIRAVEVVPLQGTVGSSAQGSLASLRVGAADADGNWPLELKTSGLPHLQGENSRYILLVWQNGKPVAVCGTFKVSASGTTSVLFNVAYRVTKSTRWVVTTVAPGEKYPGHVVMHTV